MSVQIVISGNRVIAHGTGFSVSGNTVENESTGKVYKNATIATVESVPSDIDSVGYEYHAGRFVPCAPYGPGDHNGYLMEVCTDCATPRMTEIPTRWFKWESLATVKGVVDGNTSPKSVYFPIDDLADYAELRIIMKSGTLSDNSGEGCTSTVNIGGSQCFNCQCLSNEEKHYTDEVIYICRKETYGNIRNYNGGITLYLTGSVVDIFSATFELQGRKE